MLPDDEDDVVEMSVPADAAEEARAVLRQEQFSSDQAHIMPQLFGWLAPDEQRERARYLADVTRPRGPRSSNAGTAPGYAAAYNENEEENPTTGL